MNTIESRIELLPAELLDQILDDLNTKDISRLSRCNKHLQSQTRHLLYQSEDDQAAAMRWGCTKGGLDTIHRAVSYGAPISTLPAGPTARDSSFRVLTLNLAAKYNLETFRFLVHHGAMARGSADLARVHPSMVPNMMRQLSSDSRGHPFLRVFLEAGLASQLNCAVLSDTLLSLIESADETTSSSLDLVRILLDSGASPNHVRVGGENKHSTSLLSAALLKDHPDMFCLLLERGANVDGVPVQLPLPNPLPLHVPILAATYIMANSGSRSQIKLCLEYGANMNVCVPFLVGKRKEHRISFTTPLRLYIDHLPAEHWYTYLENHGASALVYLFDNGAKFEGGDNESYTLRALEKECRSDLGSTNRQFNQYLLSVPLSPVQVILDQYPIALLPALLPALGPILQHGGLRYNTGEVLARYDYGLAGSEALSSSCGADVSRAWTSLLATLLSHDDLHEPLNVFLHRYITTKGTSTKPLGCQYRMPDFHLPPIGPLATITIKRLIAHGADINFRLSMSGWHELEPLQRADLSAPTPLQCLVHFYSKDEFAYLDHCPIPDIQSSTGVGDESDDHWASMSMRTGIFPDAFPHFPRSDTQRITWEQVEFVRFLVQECGADVQEYWEGPDVMGTAGEILVKGVRRFGDEERMMALGEGEWEGKGLFGILGVPVTHNSMAN